MNRQYRLTLALVAVLLTCLSLRLNAAPWMPFGPDGGHAREFAEDPTDHSHLYLGTVAGWLYESHDGGTNWKRLALVGKRDDLVIDSIVVDRSNPKHILVGAWVLGSPDGGLYTSSDGGQTWSSVADMQGESIRALTASPSDPKTVVAGTLKGVFRSTDGGEHWKPISPAGSQEIHEVESIAIDPVDPQIIYAGTWHLPWKTVNGGGNWTNIKKGVIDDSDVFSIIVDPKDPKVVYASACSGIYKSVTAADEFKKIQGIPNTARRTRVLMQDPKNTNIVFAGTTEGLYRTVDSGATFIRTTPPEVIVNDVYVDPSNTNRVLLATERGGVLASNDGGNSFVPSNAGFSARQITSFIVDSGRPSRIYVGLVNDKAWGGVFMSDDGGLSWNQKSGGLNGSDIYSLGQATDGTVLAGTGHGLYRLQSDMWSHVDDVLSVELPVVARPVARKGRPAPPAPKPKPVKPFDGKINAFARSGDAIYAATTDGMLRSTGGGTIWRPVSGLEKHEWNFVAAEKSTVTVATLHEIMLSQNGGETWAEVKLPESLKRLHAVTLDGTGGIWVGGREGVFFSDDAGVTWQTLRNLYVQGVNSLFYDAPTQRVLITSNNRNTIVFGVHLPDKSIQYWTSGWDLRMVRAVGDHLVGATAFDGIVVQPQMVDSGKLSSAK